MSRIKHVRIVGLAAVAAAAMPACGAEEGPPAVERFEEDGVGVVVSHRPGWAADEGWKLTPEPEVVIGEETDDPRSLFSTVRGPVRLPDGGIVAGDWLTRELRYFDASGGFVRAVGGPGQGPGEFSNLVEVHECGPGAIFAVDRGRDEISVFDAAGGFVDRYPLEPPTGVRFYVPLTCNRQGRFLAMDWGDQFEAARAREEGHYRTTVHMWLLDPQGSALHDFGAFPGVDRVNYVTPQGGRGSGPHPLGKTPARALGDERAYVGTADDFEIQVWSLDGELVQEFRRRVEGLAITDIDVERYAALAGRDETIAEELRRLRLQPETMPMPESFPAYTRFVLDSEGHLWVENYRRPWEARRFWSVFDPGGVWLGDVEVPPTFQITEIGPDYVLGILRDELDQQSVRLYPLLKGAG